VLALEAFEQLVGMFEVFDLKPFEEVFDFFDDCFCLAVAFWVVWACADVFDAVHLCVKVFAVYATTI